MPRLIHINGPPAIGKSTIAELYTADHPGTLLLDIDRVRMLVGGWQQDFVGIGEVGRQQGAGHRRAERAGNSEGTYREVLATLTDHR